MDIACNFSFLSSMRLHLGVCGSIAVYRAIELMRTMQSFHMQVSVTLTDAATRFVTPLTFSGLGAAPVFGAMFDAEDPFAHLAPGSYADAFAIVPATATTLARLATGMADDMLAAQTLAFSGPVLVAPGMNPRMWSNQATQANLATLTQRGYEVVAPSAGKVACGDEGQGKLADLHALSMCTLRLLCKGKGLHDLAGKKVMVTLGPTREQWDSVRCWTNLSTGYMGASFVYAAWLRGAEVYAVAGPGTPALPPAVHVYPCISASDMFEAAEPLWENMDYGIFTAAVADFSPTPYTEGKFKKQEHEDGFALSFKPNKDILATLGNRKTCQKVLGFAAETANLEASTYDKLVRKNADLMAGNLVGQEGSGFASPTNTVYLCSRNDKSRYLNAMSKEDIAWALLDALCAS